MELSATGNHHDPSEFIHDDVIKWKYFPRNWPFVRGIHWSPVNSPHKGQWRGALMFSLICVWINDWVNNLEAGDLRRYHAHYDVIVMWLVVRKVFFYCPQLLDSMKSNHMAETCLGWKMAFGCGYPGRNYIDATWSQDDKWDENVSSQTGGPDLGSWKTHRPIYRFGAFSTAWIW